MTLPTQYHLLLATNPGEARLYREYYPELLELCIPVFKIEQLRGRANVNRIFVTNNVAINSKFVLAAHRVLLTNNGPGDKRPIHLKLDYELVRSMQKEGMPLND